MRYHHTATRSAKETFLIHLSYILTELNRKTTQRELAQLCQVSVSTLGAVKNGRSKNVSFETMLRIADAVRLTYQVVLSSKHGKSKFTVTCESGVEYMKNSRLRISDQGRVMTTRRVNH